MSHHLQINKCSDVLSPNDDRINHGGFEDNTARTRPFRLVPLLQYCQSAISIRLNGWVVGPALGLEDVAYHRIHRGHRQSQLSLYLPTLTSCGFLLEQGFPVRAIHHRIRRHRHKIIRKCHLHRIGFWWRSVTKQTVDLSCIEIAKNYLRANGVGTYFGGWSPVVGYHHHLAGSREWHLFSKKAIRCLPSFRSQEITLSYSTPQFID